MELLDVKERRAVVALSPEDCLVLADALKAAIACDRVPQQRAFPMMAAFRAAMMAAETASVFVDGTSYTLAAAEAIIRQELQDADPLRGEASAA